MALSLIALAYDETCRECKAKKGQPCIYLSGPATVHARSPAVQALIDRVGTPTRKPHNARIRAASKRRQEKETKAQTLTYQKSPIQETLVALRSFDQAEYTALKNWLKDNGKLLLSQLHQKDRVIL